MRTAKLLAGRTCKGGTRNMFKVGDGVVHPVHGVGVVTDVSREDIIGTHTYYAIEMLADNMRLLVPVDKADEIGLTKAPERKEAQEMLSVVSKEPGTLPEEHKERAAAIDRALRSGKVLRLARAFRDLAWRGHRDRLLTVDRRQLERMKLFLGGELAVARGMDLEEARRLIERTVEASFRRAATLEAGEGVGGA